MTVSPTPSASPALKALGAEANEVARSLNYEVASGISRHVNDKILMDRAATVIRALLSALTPYSSAVEPEGDGPDFARRIKDTIAEETKSGAAASWRSCSGCHETNEGYETGRYAYSDIFGCYIGIGCTECGGIGAIWEYYSERDLADMARDIATPNRVREDREEKAVDGWVSEETKAEQYIAAEIDRAPEPLRRMGEYLADHLDEDDFKAAEPMLLGAMEAANRLAAPLQDRNISDESLALARKVVDEIDVTGWGVWAGHAIPIAVARHIAAKINDILDARGSS